MVQLAGTLLGDFLQDMNGHIFVTTVYQSIFSIIDIYDFYILFNFAYVHLHETGWKELYY